MFQSEGSFLIVKFSGIFEDLSYQGKIRIRDLVSVCLISWRIFQLHGQHLLKWYFLLQLWQTFP